MAPTVAPLAGAVRLFAAGLEVASPCVARSRDDRIARWGRKPDLPAAFGSAWSAFLDCAQVIEGGRRTLLGTLPVGRVEHTPIGLGADAMAAAIDDAGGWMPDWRIDQLEDEWQDCRSAMDEAREQLATVRTVAADTSELEELQEAVGEVVEPLDAFADAERAWRRMWRLPRGR